MALPPWSTAGYATFFASRRSVESDPARLLSEHDLTDKERTAREELHAELLSLRFPEGPQLVDEPGPFGARPLPLAGSMDDTIGGGAWFFPDQRPIVSLLMRVRINPNGAVVTPDWTQAEDRLHEWPTVGE